MAINWSALTAGVVVSGGLIEFIRRAFQAPEALQKAHRDDRSRARATIEGDNLVPLLTKLVTDVVQQAGLDPLSSRDQVLGQVEKSLGTVGYLESIDELSGLYLDRRDLAELAGDVGRWARIRGVFALTLLAATVFLFAAGIFGEFEPPDWLILVAVVVLAVGLTLSTIAWAFEIMYRNRLAKLFEKYE